MKRCPKCDTEKPLSAFAVSNASKGRLQCWCRSCNAVAYAAWKASDPERTKQVRGGWAKRNPEKNAAKAAAWKAANPERARERDAKYRAENKDRQRATHAAWREKNADDIKARRAEYRKKNRAALRKHQKRKATPPWLTPEQRKKIADFYVVIPGLNEVLGERHQVDHIVPLRGENVCGLHVPWNLQILTEEANLQKSNRFYCE